MGEEKKAETQARGRQQGWTYDTGEKPHPRLRCHLRFTMSRLLPRHSFITCQPCLVYRICSHPPRQAQWPEGALTEAGFYHPSTSWRSEKSPGGESDTGNEGRRPDGHNPHPWGGSYIYTLPKKRSKGAPTGGWLLWSWNLGHCTVLEQTSTEMYLLWHRKL